MGIKFGSAAKELGGILWRVGGWSNWISKVSPCRIWMIALKFAIPGKIW